MRIIEKIERCQREGRVCFSFEYFPPKTEAGVANLYARMERMRSMDPEFVDITWGAGGSTAGLSMEIASNARNQLGFDVLLHMTCTNMTTEQVHAHLVEAKKHNITNILALRGDPPHGSKTWTKTDGGFEYASDLVKYIRGDSEFESFGVVVAGFAECHEESPSQESDIKYLKEKVDAGADFIITQMFYDVDLFLHFVKKCRATGIKCPIVPGIMPIDGYESFMRRTKFCGTKVPQWVYDALEPIKNDDAEVKAFGIRYVTAMCRTLLNNGIPALHLYTMNLERSVTTLFHALKHSAKSSIPSNPSMPSLTFSRSAVWDDFPNGYCGDSSSPNWGETPYNVPVCKGDEPFYKECKITSLSDVASMIESFLCNALAQLPWSPLPLSGETALIVDRLISLNRKFCFTLSSQPAVNGASSRDAVFGWGAEGGHVYQKAYVQLFCPQTMASMLKSRFQASGQRFMYHFLYSKDSVHETNTPDDKNALTWGVWPGREIVQSTWVDRRGVEAIAQTVFATIRNWADGFKKDDVRARQTVLSMLEDGWVLVHVVDEGYYEADAHLRCAGDLWHVLDEVATQHRAAYPVKSER
eukprot:ANDGO_01551.mRNA.1 putative methylenetetrahydrofolate reductase